MKLWPWPRAANASPCSRRVRCGSTFFPPSLHKVKRPTFPRRSLRWPCSTKVPWRRVRMARFGAGKRVGRNSKCRRRPKCGPFHPDGTIPSGSSRNASMARPAWRITTRKKDAWPNGVRRLMGEKSPRSPQRRRRIISWPHWLFRTVNAPWPSGAGAMAGGGNMFSTKRSRIVRASAGVTGLWPLRLARSRPRSRCVWSKTRSIRVPHVSWSCAPRRTKPDRCWGRRTVCHSCAYRLEPGTTA